MTILQTIDSVSPAIFATVYSIGRSQDVSLDLLAPLQHILQQVCDMGQYKRKCGTK